MSETQSRPSVPRGRGSSRGGRSGYGSRGGPRGGSRNTTNGDNYLKAEHLTASSFEDDDEFKQLKKQYSTKLATIKEMFPDWTDEDIVFALQETDGDLEGTIERISEGNVSQWGEVKKKTKDRSRSKVKEPTPGGATDGTNPSTGRGRGGRGGHEGARGGRGRGSERGRGVGRGGRGGSSTPTNGLKHKKGSPDGAATDGYDEPAVSDENTPPDNASLEAPGTAPNADTESLIKANGPSGSPAKEATSIGTTATNTAAAITGAAVEGAKKTWASMFAKPVPPAAPKKVSPPPAPQPAPAEPEPVQEEEPEPEEPEVEVLPSPPIPTEIEAVPVVKAPPIDPALPTVAIPTKVEDLPPPKDELTESNLEQVLDTSAPAPATTVASTVDSGKDSRSAPASGPPSFVSTPLRPPTSGYIASAHKAAGTGSRTSSFQRRVLDQREAVVMPGNHAVDRTAVQFGSLGLNGADDLDVDEEREEPETRAQPPQHSPVAHPIASLPPAPQPQSLTPLQVPAETVQPNPRQAPGLPAAPSQPQQQQQQQQPAVPQQPSPQPPLAPQSMSHQTSQGSHQYNQFGRYGQQTLPQEQPVASHKPYEPFGQQAQPTQSQQTQVAPSQQQQYDGYPSHTQAPHTQAQHHQPTHAGAFSSAATDYSSYYTAEQTRGLQNYYGTPYGQQSAQTQQDAGAAQQRSSSGFGGTSADPTAQYTATQAAQTQARYGQTAEAHNSGHTTPNPTLPGQQPQGVQPQQSHLQQQHPQSQAGGQGAYPYGHPYYTSPYYTAYLNQFGYGQGYGAPFSGKGGMYGQPHQGYGISPQASFEHSSSPANIGGFGQPSIHARDTALAGAGLGDYGRSGSAQPAQTQQHSTTSGAFGGMPDVFGRSGFQNQQLSQQGSNQQSSNDDSLKPFNDPKPSAAGPSPSLNQPGRPGSATNNTLGGPGQAGQPGQSTLPAPQSQTQPGFGQYPSHHLHGTQAAQYGGLGGLGGHGTQGQTHQNSGYGNYGAGFGSGYYGSSNRGGWGGNYGGH